MSPSASKASGLNPSVQEQIKALMALDDPDHDHIFPAKDAARAVNCGCGLALVWQICGNKECGSFRTHGGCIEVKIIGENCPGKTGTDENPKGRCTDDEDLLKCVEVKDRSELCKACKGIASAQSYVERHGYEKELQQMIENHDTALQNRIAEARSKDPKWLAAWQSCKRRELEKLAAEGWKKDTDKASGSKP